MKALGAILLAGALLSAGAAFAGDEGEVITGRSVAVSGDNCDRVTPVCAAIGAHRLVPYANECQARADGATSVSFSGCFDEN